MGTARSYTECKLPGIISGILIFLIPLILLFMKLDEYPLLVFETNKTTDYYKNTNLSQETSNKQNFQFMGLTIVLNALGKSIKFPSSLLAGEHHALYYSVVDRINCYRHHPRLPGTIYSSPHTVS
jgi:hypothetical protein